MLEKILVEEEINKEWPRMILLWGPSGSGKTTEVRSVLERRKMDVEEVCGVLESVKELDERLHRVLKGEEAVGLLVLDWLDALFPREGEEELCVQCAWRLKERVIKRRRSSKPLYVVGLTTDRRSVHPAILSLFQEHIRFAAPPLSQRLQLFRCIWTTICNNNNNKDKVKLFDEIEHFGKDCHGFLPSDIEALLSDVHTQLSKHPEENLYSIMMRTKKQLKLSLLSRSSIGHVTSPSVHWSDIGGHSSVKEILQQCILWNRTKSQQLLHLGIQPPAGVLLIGPPGTGKTMLAKAVATSVKANFLSVDGKDIVRGYVGESEARLTAVFKVAAQSAPCVIFFDEIQALFGVRSERSAGGSSLISTLLLLMDTYLNGDEEVFILGATNRVDLIDPSFLRPGRFDRLIEVGLPSEQERQAILHLLTRKLPLDASVELNRLAQRTKGYSGAQLQNLCQRALLALHSVTITSSSASSSSSSSTNTNALSMDHFLQCI